MARNIYRRPGRRPARHWIERASYLGAGLGIMLIALVCYFEFFAPEAIPPVPLPEAADMRGRDELAYPAPVAPVEEAQPEEDPNLFQGEIAAGDTAGVLLQEWLGQSEIHAMAEACKNVYALGRLRAGQPYSVHLEDGRFLRFEYEADTERKLIVTREQDGENANWQARLEKIEYEIRLIRVEGEITSNLFEAMSAAGEAPALAVRLAEIFAWEINFIRDIREGDSFSLLVEKRYRDGELKGYGAMPAAEFVNRNSKFEAYVYKDSFGNNSYFNASGESLKRAFLKAPLSFTRISSRFDMQRLHPIHNTVRAHPAVDYAAPSGTPVKAIGSGEVTFRGFNKGAGNYITLKHANGYESMYLHLSGFAKNLKQGGKVRQGEIIGYVGSTGYSTGPHLDFRMKKNGQFLNPEKVLSPRDESVPQKHLAAFKTGRDRWRSYLKGEIALSEYSREKENL
ncbi:MAG: peptidoglycan DD-metalloendopeptidase family protein [Desulfovibrionaceae bacterium]|nr:peptidoglycan DD-metalloendopeptidase family protein [Desulfovibrionaceae bacterium]